MSLAPWLIIGGTSALVASIITTATASLVVGGYVAVTSGKHVAYGAIRQLLIVIAASAITYGIGHLLGVAVS